MQGGQDKSSRLWLHASWHRLTGAIFGYRVSSISYALEKVGVRGRLSGRQRRDRPSARSRDGLEAWWPGQLMTVLSRMAAEDRWPLPPSKLEVSGGEIHVWCAFLDIPRARLERLAGSLSGDERSRAARFHFERDRRRFIAGRAVLRAILGRYLAIEPGILELRYAAHGKPQLAERFDSGSLRFNLSHCRGLALYAVTRGREIGIDLEAVQELVDAEAIARRFFSPRENAALQAIPAQHRALAFFNCWTRKEAYVKGLGDGLTHPLDQFDVSLAPGEPVRITSGGRGAGLAAAAWTLRELFPPAARWVAALAVEGRAEAISCWQWEDAGGSLGDRPPEGGH